MKHLWIAGAVVSVAALVWLMVGRRRERGVVKPVLLGAIGAFLLVTGWLFAADPNAPKHEAIKTGGLAGGAVVALYALWLNDRRRRTDEDRQRVESERQALENARAEHDRSRVADERFARSVELLGHDAEQVRVGAMHGLAGLARSRAEYTQTVLDVLCAYLRRPFDLTESDDEVVVRDERELEVRLTAQRLIADLLPRADTADAPRYNLDLTRAYLEYFDLSHRQVGDLVLRAAHLRESNSAHHAVVHGGAWFTDAVSDGRLYLHDVVFHGKAWFSRFTCRQAADFTATRLLGPNKFAGAEFTGPATFRRCEFAEPVDFEDAKFTGGLTLEPARPAQARTRGMHVSLEHENALPDGWAVERRDDSGLGLVRS
ncbi:pentapeptide repeat-containing protein [Actinosynnema sp. NPDC023794]